MAISLELAAVATANLNQQYGVFAKPRHGVVFSEIGLLILGSCSLVLDGRVLDVFINAAKCRRSHGCQAGAAKSIQLRMRLM